MATGSITSTAPAPATCDCKYNNEKLRNTSSSQEPSGRRGAEGKERNTWSLNGARCRCSWKSINTDNPQLYCKPACTFSRSACPLSSRVVSILQRDWFHCRVLTPRCWLLLSNKRRWNILKWPSTQPVNGSAKRWHCWPATDKLLDLSQC